MGRIIALKHRGEKVPEGWAVDKDGTPTTDPDAALHGSLSPAGGPKGYGLGISIGMLAGLLPGMPTGKEVLGTLDADYKCTVGDLFILMDPKAFPGGETLAAGVKIDEEPLHHLAVALGAPSRFRAHIETSEEGIGVVRPPPPNVPLQPQRRIIAPVAVGGKRLLGDLLLQSQHFAASEGTNCLL